MQSPLKVSNILLLTALDLPEGVTHNFDCAFGDIITVAFKSKCCAVSLAELLTYVNDQVKETYDYLIVQPSVYWVFSQLNIPLTARYEKNVSKQKLKGIFSQIFSDSVLSFSQEKTILFCNFLPDPVLNLSNALLFQVNQYVASRIANLKNIFTNQISKCRIQEHPHVSSTFCITELLQLINKALPKIRDRVLSDALVSHLIGDSTTAQTEKSHFLLDENESEENQTAKAKSPYVQCKIGNEDVLALLDTGSELTILGKSLFDDLQRKSGCIFPTLPCNLTVKGVTGVRSKKAFFQTFIDIKFGDSAFPSPILVIPDLSVPFIIGIDFCKRFNAFIDCNANCLKLLNGELTVPWTNFEYGSGGVSVNACTLEKKIKVSIHADRHGKHLYPFLRSRLPENIDLQITSNPCANFNAVVESAKLELDSPTDEKSVTIILAGSNDFSCSNSVPDITADLNLSPLLKTKKQVVICEIFPRYDLKEDRPLSTPVNLFLKGRLRCKNNIHFLKSIGTLNKKSHFTDHGLHLNDDGKRVFADLLAQNINDTLDSQSIPMFSASQVYCPELTTVHSFSTLVDEQDNDENEPVVDFSRRPPSLTQPNENFTQPNENVRKTPSLTQPKPTATGITFNDILHHFSKLKLTFDQRLSLTKLLYEFKEIFSDDPGLCKSFIAKLRAKDNNPFVKRSYPIPFAHREAVRAEIERLLRLGIIERSSSPYSNPLVPVIKKDQSVRLCLDARTLNSKLISDSESPERVESLLARFDKPRFISTIDLSASFMQIYLDPESRDLTSFNFEGRNFRFTRVPFGLNVSMQLFIKATDTVFGPETEAFLSRFVDDFLIVSSTWEDHLAHLRVVFSSLKKAGMTLKLKKCFFMQEEVEYLGFILSKDGIRKNPEKVKAIMQFPAITNKKRLQSFIGAVNFYRKFHLTHSFLLEPLLHLLKKDVPWVWSSKEEHAFQEIKKAFSESVLLSFPDQSLPYYLNTDCSKTALAGELYQLDSEGNRCPIYFYSRVLSPSEKNYTTTEQELLAIVTCCSKFRQLILGRKVFVETDHQALTFFRQAALTSGRLTRWSLFLQEYDLDISHIKGVNNTAVDTLSRYPPELDQLQPEFDEINVFRSKVFKPNLDSKLFKQVPELTKNDPLCSKIIEKLHQNDPTTNNLYFLNDQQILFFKKPDSNKTLFCCPASLENEIIHLTHQYLGHLGTNKVHNYLKEIVVFPSMRKKINNFVTSCLDCLQSKPMNLKHPKPIPVLAEAPLDRLSVDLYGPLPRAFGSFQSILVVVDVFSKFVKFIPIRNATGVVVTRNFISKYVNVIGKPKLVITDRGPCFRSRFWDNSLKALNIKPRHSSVFHPQSNPVERFMRMLGNFFRVYCHQNHRSWVNYLSFFEQCLNNSVSESTNFAPVEILLNTPPENFLQKFISFPPVHQNLSIPEKIVLVQENLAKSAQRRERKHLTHPINLNFQEGDTVLVKSHHLSNALYGEIKKFFRLFNGPYVLGKPVGQNAFEIKDPVSGQSCGVHNVIYFRPIKL